MRVVAGIAGRLPLDVPRGLDVRPTMDKVRAALFDSIGPAVCEARVADLFAGSGALGIEALSRGAAHATFVENDREALACIANNLDRTRLAGCATVLALPVARFLAQSSRPTDASGYQFVFADPPYASRPGAHDYTPDLLGPDGVARILAPGGTLAIELSAGWRGVIPPSWRILRDQCYGRTRIVLLAV